MPIKRIVLLTATISTKTQKKEKKRSNKKNKKLIRKTRVFKRIGMHRWSAINMLGRQIVSTRSRAQMIGKVMVNGPCEVFINHRGVDTKRTVASLLYDHLVRLDLRPFLDNKNMKPGDKLFEKINSAIYGCKVGVAVFSPRYCDSYFCLHELALMTESKKKVIPIFCDVKPSQLRVTDNGTCTPAELDKFSKALEEAKYTVGLSFDSLKGNWSDVVTNAADIVIESLMDAEEEEQFQHQIHPQITY